MNLVKHIIYIYKSMIIDFMNMKELFITQSLYYVLYLGIIFIYLFLYSSLGIYFDKCSAMRSLKKTNNLYENWVKKPEMELIISTLETVPIFIKHRNLITIYMMEVIYTHIKDKKFTTVFFYDLPSLNVYETISINIKVNDKKYLIYAIEGEISYEKNISDCYKKLDEVVDELSEIFKDEKKIGPHTEKLKFDSSGKSEFTYVFFEFKSGDSLGVACYDYSENVYEEDLLSIGIRTKEFNNWLK